jgi:hypothetical protein
MQTDDELIEQARWRIANGHGNALDRWRVRRARAEQVEVPDIVYKEYNPNADIFSEQPTFSPEESQRWNEWAQANARAAIEPDLEEMAGAVNTIVEGLERKIDRHIDPVAVAKLVGDAIEPVLLNYVEQEVKKRVASVMKREAKGEVIDLPSWRHNAA